jgi:hypothetical protein
MFVPVKALAMSTGGSTGGETIDLQGVAKHFTVFGQLFNGFGSGTISLQGSLALDMWFTLGTMTFDEETGARIVWTASDNEHAVRYVRISVGSLTGSAGQSNLKLDAWIAAHPF